MLLAVAVDSADPLLEADRAPRDVVVHHQPAELEIDALARSVGRHQEATRAAERLNLGLSLRVRHAAVDHGDLVGVANTLKAPDDVAQRIPMFGEDDITDRSEKFLAAEIVREKVFRFVGDELPYTSTVIIEKFEQEGDLRRVFVAILVDRDSHKAMLIGHKGARLKEISTQSRIDMEKLFGGKVYLEVWVKVKSGWADNEAGLRAYGYE